jgi:PPOX class probable F420-dependent enzyme
MLNDAARELIESGRLAHVVTLNHDGSPQVSCVWVGLDGEDIVFASLGPWKKLSNLDRDPRVALSMEASGTNAMGLQEYLVVHGHAAVVDGGGPELLQRLALTYLGPEVVFPPMDDPPPGRVVRITPERLAGVGPWVD